MFILGLSRVRRRRRLHRRLRCRHRGRDRHLLLYPPPVRRGWGAGVMGVRTRSVSILGGRSLEGWLLGWVGVVLMRWGGCGWGRREWGVGWREWGYDSGGEVV